MLLKNWLNYWWLRVPEPRVFSVIYTFAYMGGILGGILVYFYPPVTMLDTFGDVTMKIIGLLWMGGSIIGAIAGAREAWKLERLGVYAILLGVFGYYSIVIYLGLHQTGSRWAQLTVIYFALLLFILRLAHIWQYTYKPRIN